MATWQEGTGSGNYIAGLPSSGLADVVRYPGVGSDQSIASVIESMDSILPRFRRHRTVREFASLQDVTNSATGGTVTPSIDIASPLGGRAMKLAFGASVTQHDVTISGFSLADFKSGRGKIVILAYFEEPRAISQIQCFIGTDTGFGTSIRCDYKLANDGVHHSHAIHRIVIQPDGAAADNLGTTDDVAALRLRFQRSGTPISNGVHNLPGGGAASAYVTNVWIKGVYLPEETLPFVLLTFDDASASWMTILHQELSTRGLRGTFGVNKNDVDASALFVTTANLQTLYDYGHDLSSHNLANTAFSIATIADYVAEFRTCRDWMYNAGWTRRLDYHPYVQGIYNPELSSALQSEGVRWARTINAGHALERTGGYDSMMDMPSLSLGSGMSLAAAQTLVTSAQTRQQDVVVVGHTFAATSADSVTWSQANLTGFLDWLIDELTAGRIGGVGSLSEYLRYIGVEP